MPVPVPVLMARESAGRGDGGASGGVSGGYAGQIHTSLVVEGPLEGDSTLPQDFDAMVQLVHECGARLCPLSPLKAARAAAAAR